MNDIFFLPLSNTDHYCLIDLEDRDRVIQKSFYWNSNGSHIRCGCGVDIKLLHNFVMQVNPIRNEFVIDHKNRNIFDNRKCNLREASNLQNCCNRVKQKGNYSSKYKGVSWDKKNNKWVSKIVFAGVCYYGGKFIEENKAALKANELIIKHHGEFGVLNIIQ